MNFRVYINLPQANCSIFIEHDWLVVSPLKNMKVSWDDENSQYMENHKIPCSLWDDYIVTWDDYSQYMEK